MHYGRVHIDATNAKPALEAQYLSCGCSLRSCLLSFLTTLRNQDTHDGKFVMPLKIAKSTTF